VRLGLDLTIIVMNNSAYGMIQIKQAMMGLESWGLEFGNPDFVKMAESFGARGSRVERPEDFAAVLEQSFGEPGVKLIDLAFAYPPEVD
jgi:acetolactate synthase I/II/III large subunit